jgi:hypothetical protein
VQQRAAGVDDARDVSVALGLIGREKRFGEHGYQVLRLVQVEQ